ncbi:Alpha/Beta hydrolase protein [Aspergillus parasiticus]|uniref:Alpha/Beta hydrolase protein n=1 Tax=Aspergillus parasiticus TaxID=5067 RepID=A0A5N6E215_ASPPA|nr:Alpha/Beta hydrolase protein [Aspergillus parasiticus]
MPVPVQVAYKPIAKPQVGENNYHEFEPGKVEVLPKGWKGYNGRALTSDIIVEHDVEIRVRDGCRLYVDIYRPADAQEKVPAVLGWSCYGKKYSSLTMLPITVWNCCVDLEQDLSGLEKFEGLDPQRWCPRGYAIVSVDTRGTGNSDGQIPIMGSQDAEDGYDVIEAIAKMDWCNGHIGMAGNSALAIAQWFIAALNPPSLKAIAPWEGSGDLFREQFCRGGVFSMSNFDMIIDKIIRGPSGVEDFAEMYRRSPLANAYWNDKRANMANIKCATFMSGSDITSIHTMGTIRAWLEIPHDEKWIKWSAYQEWFDLYTDTHAEEELALFFDHYLKGRENTWLLTPRVRWTTLQFGDRDPVENIVLPDFPVPNTQYRSFFLCDGALQERPPTTPSTVSYDSETFSSFCAFDYTFPQRSRLIGLPKAILFMSCPDHDDMNVYIILRKLDRNGKALLSLNFPFKAAPVNSIDEIPPKERQSTNLFQGSVGILRASHRAIDSSKSIHPQFPFHPHDREEKIQPGTIVKLEIGIWAMGVDFDEGESISVRVGGQFPSLAEYANFSAPRPEHERNKGKHIIHSGPDHPSSIILPFVPLP